MIGNLSYLHHYAPRWFTPKMAMNRSQAWASAQGWRMIRRVKLVQRPQVSFGILFGTKYKTWPRAELIHYIVIYK